MAKAASAMMAVFVETPNAGRLDSRIRIASVGTARVTFASSVTSPPPRRKWPSVIPMRQPDDGRR